MDASSHFQRSTGTKTRSARCAPHRVLGLFAALTVILAMLPPLAPLARPAAAAGEPVVDTGAHAATQRDPYTSGIYLTKYVCDSDFGGDLDQLLEYCVVAAGYE